MGVFLLVATTGHLHSPPNISATNQGEKPAWSSAAEGCSAGFPIEFALVRSNPLRFKFFLCTPGVSVCSNRL
jgi:hypothetical protein